MDNLNLSLINWQVREATNKAARNRLDYFVVGFTSFGLVYYDVSGRVKII